MVDLLVDAELLDLGLERSRSISLQPFGGGDVSSSACFVLDAQRQVRGDRVGQAVRVGDPHRGEHRLVGQARRVLDEALEQAAHARHQLLDLGGRLAFALDVLDHDLEEAFLVAFDLEQPRAR